MSARKPVEPGCDGSVLCQVRGHVTSRLTVHGHIAFSHVPLTVGQRKTIREQARAAREGADR